jgi:hypothetical protein
MDQPMEAQPKIGTPLLGSCTLADVSPEAMRRVSVGLRVFAVLTSVLACVFALIMATAGFADGQVGVGLAGLALCGAAAMYAGFRFFALRNTIRRGPALTTASIVGSPEHTSTDSEEAQQRVRRAKVWMIVVFSSIGLCILAGAIVGLIRDSVLAFAITLIGLGTVGLFAVTVGVVVAGVVRGVREVRPRRNRPA